jgi:hypothetical protein
MCLFLSSHPIYAIDRSFSSSWVQNLIETVILGRIFFAALVTKYFQGVGIRKDAGSSA